MASAPSFHSCKLERRLVFRIEWYRRVFSSVGNRPGSARPVAETENCIVAGNCFPCRDAIDAVRPIAP